MVRKLDTLEHASQIKKRIFTPSNRKYRNSQHQGGSEIILNDNPAEHLKQDTNQPV
ncbi:MULTISPECIES: hypothetical protein [unclassified Niallia]|uniref:hypothetical protein n=1 Tax=unclassified Niallia TaxID=2837522 RepID=UPI0030FA5B1D